MAVPVRCGVPDAAELVVVVGRRTGILTLSLLDRRVETLSIIEEGVRAVVRRAGSALGVPGRASVPETGVLGVETEPTADSYLSAKVRRVGAGKEGVEASVEEDIVLGARRVEELVTEGLVMELPRVRRP